MLPVEVMLAWAKATRTEVILVSAAKNQKFPWLKDPADPKAPRTFHNLGQDANHALKLLCKEFQVWEDQGVSFQGMQVCQELHILSPAVLASFGIDLKSDVLSHRPFFVDNAIMKLGLSMGTAGVGDVQWFPWVEPAAPRYRKALECMQEPAGMWQCASGEFVLLFEMMPLSKGMPVSEYDLNTHCIVLEGATNDGHFTPNGNYDKLRIQWEGGTLYIGHYQVLQVLFATHHLVPRTQRTMKKRIHLIPDCSLTKPSQQTTRVLFATHGGRGGTHPAHNYRDAGSL